MDLIEKRAQHDSYDNFNENSQFSPTVQSNFKDCFIEIKPSAFRQHDWFIIKFKQRLRCSPSGWFRSSPAFSSLKISRWHTEASRGRSRALTDLGRFSTCPASTTTGIRTTVRTDGSPTSDVSRLWRPNYISDESLAFFQRAWTRSKAFFKSTLRDSGFSDNTPVQGSYCDYRRWSLHQWRRKTAYQCHYR